jgi:hypothetical protein
MTNESIYCNKLHKFVCGIANCLICYFFRQVNEILFTVKETEGNFAYGQNLPVKHLHLLVRT